MSHYEGAWPIRAIVAKYVAYRRNQHSIAKENATQKVIQVCSESELITANEILNFLCYRRRKSVDMFTTLGSRFLAKPSNA